MNGLTIWFTGLPCSGKTTIAKKLLIKLKQAGYKVEHLDGDIVRQSLCKDLGFSKEDRRKNLERITFVSKLLTRNGVIVLATFVSPYRQVREWARGKIGNFVEVYCKCSVDECIKRDVKGMYAKAIKGEIKKFTGISDLYEEPENAEIVINTERDSVDKCVGKILEFIF